ncbi:MAG: bifunctional UDP-N-acetylglucosamine diphosphorylase/glucosamine-1-phosphate N-acetyltransferase GlmU [Bacilli bacterium]
MDINAIVLAAGKGTRMKSKYPKVIHNLLNKPMIIHVIDNLQKAGVTNIVNVIGYNANLVKEVLGDEYSYAYQEEQLGTGHAIKICRSLLEDKDGHTIVICGDTPLITSETIKNIIDVHITNNNSATILTGVLDDALAYGRIIRDNDNNVIGIVEAKDATKEQLEIKEFNTATYVFNNKQLFSLIDDISNDNSQGEYYLTDIIKIMALNKLKVQGFILNDLDQTLGINDRKALALAEQLLKERINNFHMDNGVTIIDPSTTYIGIDVNISQDTTIYPNTLIYGNTDIGEDCVIGPNTQIINSVILEGSIVEYAHISESTIKNNVKIGPYARLRQNCVIEDNVTIGNFVEMKKTLFGRNSKSAHLAYLGDSIVGKNVNIGCGAITVNYDGKKKHQTIIEDDVFVGCNVNLIAPIKLERKSLIAAGTTITKDVPSESLAIGRVKQEVKNDFTKRFKK